MGFSHYSNGRKADYGYYYETYYIDDEISEMKKMGLMYQVWKMY